MRQIEVESYNSEEVYIINRISAPLEKVDLYYVDINICDKRVSMEIDTRASVTIMGLKTWGKINNKKSLEPTKLRLKSYTGNSIHMKRQTKVPVQLDSFQRELPLIVVDGNSPTLLGGNWLQHVKLPWKEIFKVQTVEEPGQDQLKEILAKYEAVFDGKLGQVKGTNATLYVDTEAKHRYFKQRSVPYMLKKEIEDELGRLEKEGTISPVYFSEWATPIVPILKSDQSVHICGDSKVTINPVTKLDNYPIPKTEDL